MTGKIEARLRAAALKTSQNILSELLRPSTQS
jgi:hypothetical protein